MFTTKEYFFHLIFPTIQNHKWKHSYENISESFLVLIVLNINFGNILETCEKTDILHFEIFQNWSYLDLTASSLSLANV